MELRESIHKDRICILNGKSKKEVLLELIELLDKLGEVEDVEKVKERIFYREQLMSTGIGLGIGVPHVRIEGVKEPVVAIGVSHNGIPDYQSIDNKIVKIIVMIVAGKEQHQKYIRLLSQVVSKLKNPRVIENLIKARSTDEIYRIFAEKSHV